MTREEPCALCTKVRVRGKRIVSLARLGCLRGANERELGFSPIAFTQASATREAEETPPLLQQGRRREDTLAFRCSAARTDTCAQLCFRRARRLEPRADQR